MKILLVVAILFVFNVVAYGQVSISGKVVDGKNKPLEYATIVVKKDSIVMANAFTDSMGNYTIQNINTGSYNMSCSFINDKIEFLLNVNKDTIINIQLNKINNQLENVTVSAKKPLIERKVDRLIFNVENSITAIGGDALDALQKTPSIRVNNDNISMIGKSSISVMLNDRLLNLAGNDLINFLKSIKTEDIAQIEVITNPPAKYDAQGNSGLINIKTKSIKKNSFSGNVGGSYTQTTYPAGRFSSSINYQKNKWTLSVGANANKGSTAPVERMNIYYPAQSWYQTDNRIDYRKQIGGRLNVDYQISKSSSVSFQYMGGYYKPKWKEQINTIIENSSKKIDSTLSTIAETNSTSYYHSINTHFQTKWDTGRKKLSIDIDYFINNDIREKAFASSRYFSNGLPIPNTYREDKTSGKQNIPIVSGKIDMEWPTKWAALSFGAKLSFMQSNSNNAFYNKVLDKYQIDTSNSNEFQYQENVQALYVSANKSIQKWSFQAGLRGEYTQTKGYAVNYKKTNVNDYFKLFPTVYISYQQNEDNTFTLNYGQRINRPNYWDLNPFRWYLNPYTYAEGNPYLQPSFNHNIELAHTYKNVLTTSVYFSAKTNDYEQLPIISDVSRQVSIVRKNFLTSYLYLFAESYTFNKWHWLESNNEVDIYYQKVNSDLVITYPTIKGWSGYISSNNNIVFNKNKTVMGAVNIWYQFPGVDGTSHLSSQYNVDLGLKILCLHKKLQMGINASDIFKSSITSSYGFTNTIKRGFNNYYDNRNIRLSITYKFGNNNIKVNDRKLSNEEERNRAGK